MNRLHAFALVVLAIAMGFCLAGPDYSKQALAAIPVADFDAHLKTLGIPINGVSGSGPTARIDFKPEATAQQRTNANAERATFDWTQAASDARASSKAADLDQNEKKIRALSAAIVAVLDAKGVKITAEEMKTAYDAEYKKLP